MEFFVVGYDTASIGDDVKQVEEKVKAAIKETQAGNIAVIAVPNNYSIYTVEVKDKYSV